MTGCPSVQLASQKLTRADAFRCVFKRSIHVEYNSFPVNSSNRVNIKPDHFEEISTPVALSFAATGKVYLLQKEI